MKRIWTVCLCVLATVWASAKVTLPAYFTDNMVLQQKSVLSFHGKATPGKILKLTTGWNGEVYQTQVGSDGMWTLEVPTPEAGGPYTLTFTDGKKLQLKNVMVGEVWFCSGQSNMEMPVASLGKANEIAEADYPSIRLFQVKKNTSLTPLDEVTANNGGWQECTPSAVANFSSVAYFYARHLWKELGVPVGVIDCAWGGTPAEAWTGTDALKNVWGFQETATNLEQFGTDPHRLEQMYVQEYADWWSLIVEKGGVMNDGNPRWAAPDFADADWMTMDLPGYWEDKGLTGFNGAVWFRRTLSVPSACAGKPLTLHLGYLDDDDITYFNDVEVGRESGAGKQRIYTVPAELVKAGEAQLTVCVYDFDSKGGFDAKPDELYAEVDGKRIALSGKWKYRIGFAKGDLPRVPVSPTQTPWRYPAALFNAMVHPFFSFPIKGVIWYQGETNEGHASQYGEQFPALIAGWRAGWKDDFPFYFVQLANFRAQKDVQPEAEWAFLREAQAKALRMHKTGMAVAIDIVDADDIHPKNKQEVGRRLALLALAQTYGRPVTCSAPVFKDFMIRNNEVELSFEELGQGLHAKDGVVEGFIIAGPDRVFHAAKARIEGDKVVVSSPEVAVPLAVRYAWADNPRCSLYGGNGLPVAPFRTDSW